MFVSKKRHAIEKIERLEVSCESTERNGVEMQEFSFHLRHYFSENSIKYLKNVIEDLILAFNEKVCPGCYWLILGYDYDQFIKYTPLELYEMAQRVMAASPDFLGVVLHDFDILVLLKKINAQNFSILENAQIQNGETLFLDVFDGVFSAFYPKENEPAFATLLRPGMTIVEAERLLAIQNTEVAINCTKPYFSKQHRFIIECTLNKKDTVQDCLSQVFGKHGIQLTWLP